MSIATEIARLQQAKADLKTAINTKGRAITDETIDQYAAEVDAIEVGGGGTTTGDFLVRFIDYDGTVLKEEWVDSGEDATPPTLPDHSGDCSGGGLTFQEWNNDYTNVTRDTDVGATYITTDGKTHAFLTLTITSTKSVNLYLNKSNASTLTVDWGDGTQNTYTNSGSFNTGAHVYANYGDYEITMWISSGTGYYGFGQGSSTYSFLASYKDRLKKIFFGLSILIIGAQAFYEHKNLTYIVVPSHITYFSTETFKNCWSLVAVIFPKIMTTTYPNTFSSCLTLSEIVMNEGLGSINTQYLSGCYLLKSIIVPKTVGGILISAFQSCYSLEKIVLPPNLTSLGGSVFTDCRALIEVILPDTMTSIGSGIVSGCNKLSNIKLPTSVGSMDTMYSFFSCHTLETIVLPLNLTQIKTYMYAYAKKIKYLKIPSSVTSIASSAFYEVLILEYDFTDHTSVPSLAATDAFTGISLICKIKVPLALEAAWKEATNWVTYANYIVGV